MSQFIYSIVFSCIILGCFLIYDKQANQPYIQKQKINTYIVIISSTFAFCYYFLLSDKKDSLSLTENTTNTPKAPF